MGETVLIQGTIRVLEGSQHGMLWGRMLGWDSKVVAVALGLTLRCQAVRELKMRRKCRKRQNALVYVAVVVLVWLITVDRVRCLLRRHFLSLLRMKLSLRAPLLQLRQPVQLKLWIHVFIQSSMAPRLRQHTPRQQRPRPLIPLLRVPRQVTLLRYPCVSRQQAPLHKAPTQLLRLEV